MIIIGALLAIVLALSSSPVFAAESQNSVRLQLSPTSQRITLEPDSVYNGTFMLRNIGETEFHYTIDISPYQVTDDSYLPSYSIENSYTQIVDWVTFDNESGLLEPGGAVEINYTITVPLDVPAGGQYAVLTAQTSDGNISGSSVRTVSRIGMVLYATVSGTTRKSGEIVSNKVNGIIFNNDLFATSTVINTGNVDAEATYYLEAINLFNNSVAYSNKSEPTTKIVLPGTTRTNIISWEGSPALGLFRVEHNVEYLGHVENVSKIVFLCPVWFLVASIAFIILVILLIIARIRARQAKKKKRGFGL